MSSHLDVHPSKWFITPTKKKLETIFKTYLKKRNWFWPIKKQASAPHGGVIFASKKTTAVRSSESLSA